MVQWFNKEAIMAVLNPKNISLLSPKLWVPTVSHLDYGALRCDFDAILFDKDNCLTAPYQPHLLHPEAVARCKAAFGANMAVLSNCVGCDPQYRRETEEFERVNGIAVIRHSAKKPNCFPSVLRHFSDLGAPRIALIGDRLTTDILMANINGMFGILVDAHTEEGDDWGAVGVRRVEHLWLAWNRVDYAKDHKYVFTCYYLPLPVLMITHCQCS